MDSNNRYHYTNEEYPWCGPKVPIARSTGFFDPEYSSYWSMISNLRLEKSANPLSGFRSIWKRWKSPSATAAVDYRNRKVSIVFKCFHGNEYLSGDRDICLRIISICGGQHADQAADNSSSQIWDNQTSQQHFIFLLSMMMSWQQSPSDRSEYLINTTCFSRLL